MAKQEENYTRVPNIILDDTTLNVYEFRIMVHIARQTIGYGKKSDGISIGQFVDATGISNRKVQTTIRGLEKKKYIKVTRHTIKGKGKSFNRYSFTLQHRVPYLEHDVPNPIAPCAIPLEHDVPIQKKIEQKKIDKRREREHTSNNIYFSISGDELKREVHSFINDTSMAANNRSAYKAKLRKQIDKEHPQTLETFEEWYLNSKCKDLLDKYRGKEYQGNSIVSIHNYMDTKGFSDEDKFIIQTMDSKGANHTQCFSRLDEIEDELRECI